jgi:Mn2+/Fe2+ NRAMP family transporter
MCAQRDCARAAMPIKPREETGVAKKMEYQGAAVSAGAVCRTGADQVAVRGALGRISDADANQRQGWSWTRRLLAFLVIMGPGLITMVGDNDAGGVTTYAQAGQAYGVSLLWVFPILLVVLYVAQEMVGRLGAVTGVGHGQLLRTRFGKFWAAFSVFDLFLLNFLTLMTEFIGIDLGFRFFGVSPYLSVPVAAGFLIVLILAGKLHRWERYMFALILVSLLVVPLAFLPHVQWGMVGRDLVVPGVAGGLSTTAMIFIIGIVGTTIAPWQLFFQQGNVVDKKIGIRFTNYARMDTFVGSVITNVAGAGFVIAGAFAFMHTPLAGQFSNAYRIAVGFAQHVTPFMGTLFAILLLTAALIGAAAVTLSSAYSFSDMFGSLRGSLNNSFRQAKGFYLMYAGMVLLAAGIVLLPNLPLGVVNLGVQVLAGVLLPSALGFLVLLCNDKALLGPWVNTAWVNTIATLIVGALLQLSLILTITTVFPAANVVAITVFTGIPVVLATIYVAIHERLRTGRWGLDPAERLRRLNWTTPSDVLEHKPPMSRGRAWVLGVMRGYLVVAMVLSVVSLVQIAH